MKHDVAYGGLQELDGEGADDHLAAAPDSEELDSAWNNPRNRALADHKYKADMSRWGCQDQDEGRLIDELCDLENSGIAAIYFWGVTDRNNRGWPVTNRDIADFPRRPAFVS